MVDGGRLVVCATPIGNLGDVSRRLSEELSRADLIFAEDTRRTAVLLAHLGVSTPMKSLFVGNEQSRTDELVDQVEAGKQVALVTDAGMPVVSDPGADAVAAVRAAGFPVTVLPGPSAVTTALAVSGFPGDRFVFEGFLPRKGRERGVRIIRMVDEDRPVVLFASPARLAGDLTDLEELLGGERLVAITRELTKLHEEVWVGDLQSAVVKWSNVKPKGEFTVVVGPARENPVDLDEAIEEAQRLIGEGATMSGAARQVAAETGVSRRLLYEALLSSQERS